MKKVAFLSSLLAATGLILTTTVKPAAAITFGFNNIFPTNSGSELSGDPFINDFQLDVTESSGNIVFKFLNKTTTASHFIGGVSFSDQAGLLSSMSLNTGNVGTVTFGQSSGSFPQGNKVDGFVNTFSAAKSGAASNGVNGGETLGVSFAGNYNQVISALNAGSLKVGIHVQGLPQGQSDSFVTESQNVPEPLTLLGSGVALGFGALFQKERSKRKRALV
jgi:hypothetical protein